MPPQLGDPLAIGAPWPFPVPGSMLNAPGVVPEPPSWEDTWLDAWPFSLIGRFFHRAWQFFGDFVGAIGTGADWLLGSAFKSFYAWERPFWKRFLSDEALKEYPEVDWGWHLTDVLGLALRLPFHALWSIVDKARDQMGYWIARLESVPYTWVRDLVLVPDGLPWGEWANYPAPDPAWGIGRASQYLWALLIRIITYRLEGVQTALAGVLGVIIINLSSVATDVTSTLARIPGNLLGFLTDISDWVSVHLKKLIDDLSGLAGRILTAVTVDLPATLGGLAQSVADLVGPQITAAIAGLGDIAAKVKDLIKPLTDALGTSLGNLHQFAEAQFVGIVTTLSGIVTAVITAIPNLVGAIIPTLTATLGGLRTVILVNLDGTGRWIVDRIKDAQAALGTALTSAISSVKTNLAGFDAWVTERLISIKDALASLPQNLPDLVLGRLRDALNTITQNTERLTGWVWDRFKPTLDKLGADVTGIPAAVRDFVKPLTDPLGLALGGLSTDLQLRFRDLGIDLGVIKDDINTNTNVAGTDLLNAILPPIMGGQNNIFDFVKAIGDFLGGFWGGLARWHADMTVLMTPGREFGVQWQDFNPWQLLGDRLVGPAARTIFQVIKPVVEGMGQLTDTGVSGLVAHFQELGYMTPTHANDSLPRVQTIVREMAVGLGAFALAGHTIGFWKNFGLSELSAIFWKLTNFELITGAAVGALAATTLDTPLKYYYNSLFRPNLPPLADLSMMYAKHQISVEEFRDKLPFYGFSPEIIGWYEEYIFRDPRLFEVVRLAEITEPPPEVPDQARRYLEHAGIPMEDESDWWYYYKFAKAGYEDLDIPVLVHVAKFAVSRKEQTQYMMQVRRLFRDGFITEPRATELYQAGWVPKRPVAFRMEASLLERTYEVLDEKRAIVLSSLRRGLVDEGEAYNGLVDLGLDQQRAALSIMSTRLGLIRTGRLVAPEAALLSPPEEEEE